MKKRKLIHKHKPLPYSREVRINPKTVIITTSMKSDEEVRLAYLKKVEDYQKVPRIMNKKTSKGPIGKANMI